MNTYKIMEEQAGQRQVISCKYEKSACVCTSHYASIEEFFTMKPKKSIFDGNMQWYQIKGNDKVYLTQ